MEYVSEGVNLGKFLKLINQRVFGSSDSIRQIYVVFGLREQDRARCHQSEALCFGDTVWDERFNMSSARVQQSLMVSVSSGCSRASW